MKKVACSDWYRSWGLGHNKLGTLQKTGENSYKWTGKAQGRHNQTLRSRYSATFDVVDGGIVNASDSLPHYNDVHTAIELLNKPEPAKREPAKRVTRPKTIKNKNQMKLL